MRHALSDLARADDHVSAWVLIPLNRTLVFEIPSMRIEFAVCRLAASLLVPIFIGLATPALMGNFSSFLCAVITMVCLDVFILDSAI